MATQIIKLTKKSAKIQLVSRTGELSSIKTIKVEKSTHLMDLIGWLHSQEDIKAVLDHFNFGDAHYLSIKKHELMSKNEREAKEAQGQAKWESYENTSEYKQETKRNKKEVAQYFNSLGTKK